MKIFERNRHSYSAQPARKFPDASSACASDRWGFRVLRIAGQRVEDGVVALVVFASIEMDLRQPVSELGAGGIQPYCLPGFGPGFVEAKIVAQDVS